MNKKVLLVEDEHPYMAQGILEAMGGYEISFAKNGLDALEKFLEDCCYDIVLLDLRLPGLHGFQVLEAIKKAEPDVPVIITSVFTDKKTRETSKALGAADYFTKPLNFRKLHERMGQLIALAQAKRKTGDTLRFEQGQAEKLAKIRRLMLLRERAAKSGIDTPPEVIIEIQDLERDLGT